MRKKFKKQEVPKKNERPKKIAKNRAVQKTLSRSK